MKKEKESKEVSPQFIRLPRAGKHCPHTGLSRASMNELILGDNPKVRSASLCRAGSARGIRLVHYESLIDYIYKCSNVKRAK